MKRLRGLRPGFPGLWVGCLIALMGAQAAGAQEEGGGIAGALLDPNGAMVTGLDTPLYMTSSSSGREYSANVSPDGHYAVNDLPPGSYRLNFPISCCMYRSYSQDEVVIASGQLLKLDLNLQWGINLGTIGDDPGMLSNDMRAKAGDLSGPPPRMPDGRPDLSGVWYNVPPAGPRPRPELQPWAEEIAKQLAALGQQGPAAYCLPQSAVPTTLPFPYKLVQTGNLIVQLVEFMTPGYRQIFLDGRDLPEIWNPAWMGHSVGTWDGNTLVVTSEGFNEITPGFGVHSDQLKVTERYTRTDFGHMRIEITAEDPKAYKQRFTRTFAAELVPDEEILEFVCAEGNDPTLYAQPHWKGRP